MQTAALLASSLVRENVDPAVADLVFRDTDFLNFLMAKGRTFKIEGAYPMQWALNRSGNTSGEVFVEGQAVPAPGKQVYTRASISPFYERVAVGVTGHARDQIRNGGTITDAEKDELTKGTADLYRAIEGQLLGSTQDRGIASVIDSADTYAGIDPGTITETAAYESAVGGALTFSVLETLWETMVGNPRNAKPSFILCRENQINNYLALAGLSGSGVGVFRQDLASGGAVDYGLFKNPVSYNGAMFQLVRDLLTTEMYFLDLGTDKKDFGLCEVRPIQVDQLGKVDDGDRSVISWAGMPVVKYRRRQAVLRTLTA